MKIKTSNLFSIYFLILCIGAVGSVIYNDFNGKPIDIAILVCGIFGALSVIYAKFRVVSVGNVFSFGPKLLTSRERLFYYSGYLLLLIGLILGASLHF
jgi:hypothetical protein